MTQPEDTTIRRRPDGSIDIPFYARRAAQQRHAAMQALPVTFFRGLIRALAASGRRRPAAGDTVPSRPLLRYIGSHHD